MLKNKYVVILSIFIIASLLTIISCGRKGTLHPNTAPFIEITQYSGVTKPDTLNEQEMFEEIGSIVDSATYQYDSLFYQKIYWNAWDEDGTVVSYAYRIGTWDTTITPNDWVYDRAYGVQTDPDSGWVLHLQPDSTMDIWTSPNKLYPRATVFFPSTDTTDFRKNFGKFEVKCKDNDGKVSKPAEKYFVTWSDVPETSVCTSQGVIDSQRVGTAILFNFKALKDDDPYGDDPAYFKYRLVYYGKTNVEDSMTVEWNEADVLDSTIWYSTKDFPDDPGKKDNKSQVLLMKNYPEDDSLKPTLKVNKFDRVTQIQAKTVDKAGIEDPDYAKMTFFVRGHFKPETMPFMSQWTDLPKKLGGSAEPNGELNILPKIFVLGEHTYLTYMSESTVIPTELVSGELHYADRFYMDRNDSLSAIWSDNIEINMKWSYLGEYEFSEDKDKKEFTGHSYSYDEDLDEYFQYYCDIEYMDIQLDGGVDGLPPISTKTVSDESGVWMRIPIYKKQECKLFDISPSEHIFKVRAVDFQGAVDKSPESLKFILYEKKDADDKTNILLIDDTDNRIIFSVEDSVDTFYENLLTICSESVSVYDLFEDTLKNIATKNSECRNDDLAPSFAPSDIQGYKLVLWYSNNPKDFYTDVTKNHMIQHYDVLAYYLESGGNFLFTGCAKVWDPPLQINRVFLEEYAGLADSSSTLSNSLQENNWLWGTPTPTNSMFTGANGTGDDFSDIDTLHLNLHLFNWSDLNPNLSNYFPEYFPFNTYLGAIGNVTFLELNEAEPIFTCIADTLAEHQIYDGACVGSKYTKSGTTGTAYILGFPLYYIELDDAKVFLNKVFYEIGMN